MDTENCEVFGKSAACDENRFCHVGWAGGEGGSGVRKCRCLIIMLWLLERTET